MLKVQNANRGLLIFLMSILTIGFTNAQQKLTGTFCVSSSTAGNYAECLTFFKSGRFEYSTGGDLGDEFFGKGIYSRENNILILNYNKTELNNFSSYHKYTNLTNNKDLVAIEIKVMNTHGEPIPWVNIFINDNEVKKTNKLGELFLEFQKLESFINFEAAFVGYQRHKFKIRQDLSSKIEVYLKEGQFEGTPILNQIDSLNILEFNDKYFKMEGKDNIIRKWIKIEN